MEITKAQVQEILDTLPEDAPLEDIQYHIYVRQKIQEGLDDVAAGRVISHDEVQRRLATFTRSWTYVARSSSRRRGGMAE